MPESPPKWLAPFFYTSCVFLLLSTLLTFVSYWKKQPDHLNKAIADHTIILTGTPVREHCTTCHPEGSRPDKDNLAIIKTKHPDIGSHDFEKLGCTACHLGEGMALDKIISHGLPGNGAKSILAGRDLQASCFTCHSISPLIGAEKVWSGYKLFQEKACATCHRIAKNGTGGRYGPDLSRIGSYLGIDLIQDAIRNPGKDLPSSLMPRFPLSKSQSRQISYFLKSRITNPYYATPMQVAFNDTTPPMINLAANLPIVTPGEKLLHNKQCLGCHQFKSFDGRVAPDLTYIGQIRNRAYLEKFTKQPTALIPGATMPAIYMTENEETLLVDFLSKTYFSIDMNRQLSRVQESEEKRLYMTLCQRCHAAAGDGRGPIQPNLSGFPRAFFNNQDFFRRVSNDQIHKSIQKGIPGTSMPPYEKIITRDQTEKLIKLIFVAFVGIDQLDKTTLPPLLPKPDGTIDSSTQKKLFEANCIRCHGKNGRGKGVEYLNHQPRPRNLTNRYYFAERSDDHLARVIADGVPGTAMHPFRHTLKDEQIWGLVDLVRSFAGSSK